MSTNFYVIIDRCDACGRQDRFHLGKRAAGWSFLFRGYKEYNPEDYGDQPIIPIEKYQEVSIGSRKEWLAFFGTVGKSATLISQYEETYDSREFLESLEPPTAAQIAWEDKNQFRLPRARDEEGFRVSYDEFC